MTRIDCEVHLLPAHALKKADLIEHQGQVYAISAVKRKHATCIFELVLLNRLLCAYQKRQNGESSAPAPILEIKRYSKATLKKLILHED